VAQGADQSVVCHGFMATQPSLLLAWRRASRRGIIIIVEVISYCRWIV